MAKKLSKRVLNTVGKGVIARYEQFLLFPQCFQKACFPGASKGVVVWEWVNAIATANAISWQLVTHPSVCPGFLTQLPFPKPFTCIRDVRERSQERKFDATGY